MEASIPRRSVAPACFIALLATSTGCASLAFKPAVESTGEYRNLSAHTQKAEELTSEEAEDVKVMVGQLPAGMAVKDGTLDYDHERYELLGRVSAQYKDPSAVNLGLWFYDYKAGERWRTGLCAWQVPLSWVTLMLWSWVSPSYYPCRVSVGEPEERRDAIVETLRRAAKATGANLVVVSGFGGIDFVTLKGGEVVSASAISDLSAVGHAFRIKGTGAGNSGPSPVPATGNTSL